MPKGGFLGEFEVYVLLSLVHLGDEAYGLKVRQDIAARTGRHTAIGAVYATLGRLHDKGFVSFRLSDPAPVQGGRARKLYVLTAPGLRALRLSTSMIGRMMAGAEPTLNKGRVR